VSKLRMSAAQEYFILAQQLLWRHRNSLTFTLTFFFVFLHPAYRENCVYMYTWATRVYVHMHMFVCVCVCVCINTHTHTHSPSAFWAREVTLTLTTRAQNEQQYNRQCSYSKH
jgi:hypothetical protein